MAWKYIIVKRGVMEVPFVFPETEDHREVASLLSIRSIEDSIIGAGFCVHSPDLEGTCGWSCYGKSVSLGMSSSPIEDSAILNRMLGNWL
jgi:hypothetical protein